MPVCAIGHAFCLASPNLLSLPGSYSGMETSGDRGGAAWLPRVHSSAFPVLTSLQILMPELASLRIAVMEEGNKFLGHRIIPINALHSGKERAS